MLGQIVWHNDSTGETQYWFMNEERIVRRGTVIDEAGAAIFIGSPFKIVGTNANQIVWHNDATGETQYWFMDEERIVRRGTVIDETGTAIFIGPPFRIFGTNANQIVWHNDSTGETQYWFMNEERIVRRGTVIDEAGAAIFIGPPFRIVGTNPNQIVWHNDATGETQYWFMNEEKLVRRGTVIDEAGAAIFIGPPFKIVGTNLNQIVWHNDATGETQYWFMNEERIVRRGTVTDEAGAAIIIGPPFRVVGTNSHQEVALGAAAKIIATAYAQTGDRLGPLGLPTSSTQPTTNGFAKFFQGGDIRVLGDGTLAVNQRAATTIRFKGLHCFGKQAGPGSDEPYVVIGVYPPMKRELSLAKKFPSSGSFEGVESGSQRIEVEDVVTGRPPEDIVVYCVVMEHDSGNEEEVRDAIKKALDEAANAVEAAAGVDVPDDWVNILTLGLANAITSLLDLGDDVIGSFPLDFSFVELRELGDRPKPLLQQGDIKFNFESNLITDGDASYKVYFEVFTEIINRPLAVQS